MSCFACAMEQKLLLLQIWTIPFYYNRNRSKRIDLFRKEVQKLEACGVRWHAAKNVQRANSLHADPIKNSWRKIAFLLYYKGYNMEMYRSGRNENDSKSNWLFGSGFPVLLGFMRVFRLREWTIFGRSLLKFSPKFSRNARSILKFNIWSITQVVVRGRTRNLTGFLEVGFRFC